MIRLGLIGAGRWGRNYIKTIAAQEGVHLARLASRNPASAALVPPDCIISADWRALIDAGDLDGVIIAAPPALHAVMAESAINAGLPVLIEKPLTLDLSEARRLQSLAQAKRARVLVDHTHLFHPAFETLRRQQPQLGTIHTIRSAAGNHGPYRTDASVLWDWGSHDVAMCIAVAGRAPTGIQAARVASALIDGVTAESLRLELDFGAHLHAEILISNMVDKQRWFAVYGADGVLVYDDLAKDKLVRHTAVAANQVPAGAGEPIAIPADLPLQQAVRSFATLIQSNAPDIESLNLGVQVVAVLEHAALHLAAGAE